MSEERFTEVKTLRVKLHCECGEEMKFTGSVKPMYPPLYEHECPKCGNRNSPRTKYPTVRYEEIKDGSELD